MLIDNDKGCSHYFCYDVSKNPLEKKYEFGSFRLTDTKLQKNKPYLTKARWLDTLQQSISSLPKDRNGLIFYIHGFQGDNIFFMQQSGYIIQNEIFNDSNHSYGMAISLQWTSVLNYEMAVENAFEKGKNLSTIVDTIYQFAKGNDPDAPITILCHSMGNRVWQGLYDGWLKINPNIHLTNVMMFAADVESDIFESSFQDIATKTDHLYVYFHNEDKTLRMANALKNHGRLGITGPKNQTLLPANIVARDMTAIHDDQTFAGNITLHRYYYGSPTVRKEILQILQGSFK